MAGPNDPSFWYSNAQPWLRKLAERSYYTLPKTMETALGGSDPKSADSISTVRAGTRGARYAQERRINAIRANQGVNTPFDPIADVPGDMTDDERTQSERLIGEMQGTLPVTAGTGSNKDTLSKYRGGTARPAGYDAALNGAIGDANNEQDSLRDYLFGRYKADATRAGTLSDTVQSQNALNADVNAGVIGGNAALMNQQQTLTDAMSPDWRSNVALNPDKKTALSGMTPETQAPGSSTKPEDLPSSGTLASGQTTLTPQKRISAINSMRGR